MSKCNRYFMLASITLLSVIANPQTRINKLETKFVALGLLAEMPTNPYGGHPL